MRPLSRVLKSCIQKDYNLWYLCMHEMTSSLIKPTTPTPKESDRYVPDVSLANEHTSVVDGLGQVELEHEGLESSL